MRKRLINILYSNKEEYTMDKKFSWNEIHAGTTAFSKRWQGALTMPPELLKAHQALDRRL
jgi:hypothetical protein